MSFHVFFALSTGLKEPLTVPVGTTAEIFAHVAEVEETLSIKRTRYKDNPEHWDHFDEEFKRGFQSVSDEVLCETAEKHNIWVQWLYERFADWAKDPVVDGEVLTPDEAAKFWPGLQMLTVEPGRWTADYYRSRMEELYEVMRGRPSAGMTLDEKPLTPKQCAAVIRLFERFLDPSDLRLDVPHGRDFLASSYDGGYSWCDKCCRAIGEGDEAFCKRRKCPLLEDAA